MKNYRKLSGVTKIFLSILLSIICVTQVTGNCFAASSEETTWDMETTSQLTFANLTASQLTLANLAGNQLNITNMVTRNMFFLPRFMGILQGLPKIVNVTVELQADKTVNKNQILVSAYNSTVNIRYYGIQEQKQTAVFNDLTASTIQLSFVAKDKMTDGKPTIMLDGNKLVVTYQVGNKTTPQYDISFNIIRLMQFISKSVGGSGTWQIALTPQKPAEQKSSNDSSGGNGGNTPEEPDTPEEPVVPEVPEEEAPPVVEGGMPDFGEDEGKDDSIIGGSDLPDDEVSGVPEIDNGPTFGNNLPEQSQEDQPSVSESTNEPPSSMTDEPIFGGGLPSE